VQARSDRFVLKVAYLLGVLLYLLGHELIVL
jgi:hypothetical protein